MSIHSIGEHRRRNEVLRATLQPEGQAIGTFRARSTRDANALERDGHPVFAMNDVHAPAAESPTIEILFADGVWLLCEGQELELEG